MVLKDCIGLSKDIGGDEVNKLLTELNKENGFALKEGDSAHDALRLAALTVRSDFAARSGARR